jgi:hypothetical protein
MVSIPRIRRGYRDAGRVNSLLALWGFVDEYTFLTKAGHVGVMYQLTGCRPRVPDSRPAARGRPSVRIGGSAEVPAKGAEENTRDDRRRRFCKAAPAVERTAPDDGEPRRRDGTTDRGAVALRGRRSICRSECCWCGNRCSRASSRRRRRSARCGRSAGTACGERAEGSSGTASRRTAMTTWCSATRMAIRCGSRSCSRRCCNRQPRRQVDGRVAVPTGTPPTNVRALRECPDRRCYGRQPECGRSSRMLHEESGRSRAGLVYNLRIRTRRNRTGRVKLCRVLRQIRGTL